VLAHGKYAINKMIPKIYSKNNDIDEIEVAEIIKEICQKYDLPLFTKEIVIEKGVVPHSHPILTLNTRVKDKRSLLATLVHEQFHWYAQNHPKYNECVSYLKSKYEDDGEHNKSGTYPNSYWEHIIVCFNTRNYLKSFLSSEDLEWIYEQWQPYPALENLIVQRYKEVQVDLERFNTIFVK